VSVVALKQRTKILLERRCTITTNASEATHRGAGHFEVAPKECQLKRRCIITQGARKSTQRGAGHFEVAPKEFQLKRLELESAVDAEAGNISQKSAVYSLYIKIR